MLKLELWQSLLLWGGIAAAYLGWRYFLKPAGKSAGKGGGKRK